MYYRVAIQVEPSPLWQWKSTMLSSLDTLFQFLRLFQALPQDHVRVFSSSSQEGLKEQFAQENKDLAIRTISLARLNRAGSSAQRSEQPQTTDLPASDAAVGGSLHSVATRGVHLYREYGSASVASSLAGQRRRFASDPLCPSQ